MRYESEREREEWKDKKEGTKKEEWDMINRERERVWVREREQNEWGKWIVDIQKRIYTNIFLFMSLKWIKPYYDDAQCLRILVT